MSPLTFVAVIVAALIIGVCCQLIGRSRAGYEWAIVAVAALYGELLGNGLLAPRFGALLDGLPVVALLSGAVTGGLLLLIFRTFGSPISPRHRVVAEAEVEVIPCSEVVRLRFSPELLQDPIIYRMRTRFGVSTRFDSAQITGGRGWVELHISGAQPAVEAAVALARQSGIQVEDAHEERVPTPLAA